MREIRSRHGKWSVPSPTYRRVAVTVALLPKLPSARISFSRKFRVAAQQAASASEAHRSIWNETPGGSFLTFSISFLFGESRPGKHLHAYLYTRIYKNAPPGPETPFVDVRSKPNFGFAPVYSYCDGISIPVGGME